MSFPAYPSYKESGIEWLDEVPTHWTIRPLKRLGRFAAGAGFPHEDQGVRGEELPFYKVNALARADDRGILPPSDDTISRETASRLRAFVFPAGSIVFAKIGAALLLGRLRLISTDSCLDNNLMGITINEHNNRDYVRYLMSLVKFDLISNPGTVPSLNESQIANVAFGVPPFDEQVAIAAFLDRETAKIDALVEEQRCLIALLKEKRQAVISHAVTKGLNPNAPMKDSGVEWLGEVPAHWQITRLKHISSTYCDGPFGSSLKSEHYVETGARVVRLQNIKSNEFDDTDAVYVDIKYFEESLKGHEVIDGDILIAGLGDDRNIVGRSCTAPVGVGPAIVKADCFRFRLRSEHLASFVSAQLTSGASYAAGFLSSGSTRSRIPAGTMAQRIVVVPLYDEQVTISRWIVETVSNFDELLAEAFLASILLQERRAALISAAVTGKIDVRGSAIRTVPTGRARARGLIAAEIIERSTHQATFGRVKLQKIAYLAEAHAGVTELEGAYLREAAGPLDRGMIREMESEACILAGIKVEQPDGAGSAVAYRLGSRRGAHLQDLAALLGERAAKFDKLIKDFGTINTKGAEAVATLYAVWNDELIDGETPTDMEIKLAVLSEWHPEKAKKFRISELEVWLDWMRRHNLVPTGAGPKTSTGRLFA